MATFHLQTCYWPGVGMAVIYFTISGYLDDVTEVRAQVRIRDSLTASDMYCRVPANTSGSDETVITRINGASGNLLVTIVAGTTGDFWDLAHSDSLSTGDLICYRTSFGSGISLTIIGCSLDGSSTLLVAAYCDWGPSAGDTGYYEIVGYLYDSAAEYGYKFRTAATLSYMRVYISVNSYDAAATFQLRVNGANGNQSVSITAGTTGAFEDTTHSDSIGSGDIVNYKLSSGATSGNIKLTTAHIKSGSSARQIAAGGTAGHSANNVKYQPIEGRPRVVVSTEADIKREMELDDKVAQNGQVYVYSNSTGASTIYTLRKNGGDGNISMTVAAAATGRFEDTANTDEYSNGDEINWKVDAGTSGDIYLTCLGYEETAKEEGGLMPWVLSKPTMIMAG